VAAGTAPPRHSTVATARVCTGAGVRMGVGARHAVPLVC
jgi:hypothetical protein